MTIRRSIITAMAALALAGGITLTTSGVAQADVLPVNQQMCQERNDFLTFTGMNGTDRICFATDGNPGDWRGDIWHVGQIWSGHNSGVLYFNEGTETGKSTPFGPNQHFFCNDCRITGFHMN
ncbi:hypothetical protein ACH4VR_12995 [Streptomyces sp. NPDC020883]|uniref:hypothetical protein n=1 Tax=unclassified Streptomyces TaxID=2593676 RepID=UPI0034E28747